MVDWSEVPIGGHIEAALQAHSDAGFRTVFVHASPDWHAGVRSGDGPTSPLTTFAAGPVKPDQWALARDLGLRIHAHAGTGTEQAGIGALTSMLGEDVTLVHCCDFDDPDLDLASSGAHIVLTPSSEMAAGPALQIQEAGRSGDPTRVRVDNEKNGPGDIFAQMRRPSPAARHALRPEARRQGRRPQTPEYP